MTLWKAPTPVPSLVFVLNAIVGLIVVPHTKPLERIAAPPSELIFPPDLAPLYDADISVIAIVVNVGILIVLILNSFE